MASGPITKRVKRADSETTGQGDEATVKRVNAETNLRLNWKSAEDVNTARAIEKAKKMSVESVPDEGGLPVA